MASSTFFHKPELALRRAVELEGINQDDAALTLLHDVLSSRRHRTWSPAYEQIMMVYLDLCLKLFKAREAKDGLHQYRNLSQSQAPGSLEKVIRYLMEQAERKCAEATAYAETLASNTSNNNNSSNGDTVVVVVRSSSGAAGPPPPVTSPSGGEDDDFGASPQAILLSTMSTDPAKSQRDSAFVMPSLKFLWETYRTILDILRSNSKLEHVYHAAAQSALKFCRNYKRRMEFRHLCDMLRMHLGNLRQYGSISEVEGEGSKTNNKVRGWEGWTTDSIELHLQTRFAQLETASVLHRYTEGFRTCEDIYNILQISHARRKANPDVPPPKAKLMASYYEKLTTLFWVSENYLFHAFAWYKYYALCKEFNRGMSEEVKSRQASAVLLACLCIPQLPGPEDKLHGITSTMEDGIIKQKMARMATLLGFHTRHPTREALLAEIRAKNIVDQVPDYLRELYFLLEDNSDPLIMVERARPLLEKLQHETGATTSTDAEELNDDVEDTSLGRYVKPLTSVLLLKLLVNLASVYHTVSIERLKKLTGGLGLTFEQVEKSIVLFTQNKTLSVRIDHRAGCLRFGDAQLESDEMRSQLTVLAKQLEAVCRILHPPKDGIRLHRRTELFAEIRNNLMPEHAAILERKDLIEKRKEEAERLIQEKQREEKRIKSAEEAARKDEDAKRLAREQRLRDVEKQRRIQQELDNKEKMRFLQAMDKKMDDITEEEMAKIDIEALQSEHKEKIEKKKEEAERKTREAAKRLDYLVRAIRIEELPLIKKKYDEKTKADKERYVQEIQEKKVAARQQWEADVKDKALLQEHNVFAYFAEFEHAVMKGRGEKYAELCREEDQRAEIAAEKAKFKRARKRKDDEVRLKEEEESRRQEEVERQKAGEEQKKRDEAKREREAKEEERRVAEDRRMEEERRKREGARVPAGGSGETTPRGDGAFSSNSAKEGIYVPPSQRNRVAAGAGGGSGGVRFEQGGYPGGGRYESRPGGARADDRGGGGGARRGGGGDDRRGGNDDRSGGGGYEDRRGAGGGYGRGDDRRGGAGGFSDRRGPAGAGGEDRGGPGGSDRRGTGGPRDDRSGPPPASGNNRWRN